MVVVFPRKTGKSSCTVQPMYPTALSSDFGQRLPPCREVKQGSLEIVQPCKAERGTLPPFMRQQSALSQWGVRSRTSA